MGQKQKSLDTVYSAHSRNILVPDQINRVSMFGVEYYLTALGNYGITTEMWTKGDFWPNQALQGYICWMTSNVRYSFYSTQQPCCNARR